MTLSEAFLFNHLGEISNIPLKLNMKDNLLYFYSLSLCREPGNYLFSLCLGFVEGARMEAEGREKRKMGTEESESESVDRRGKS